MLHNVSRDCPRSLSTCSITRCVTRGGTSTCHSLLGKSRASRRTSRSSTSRGSSNGSSSSSLLVLATSAMIVTPTTSRRGSRRNGKVVLKGPRGTSSTIHVLGVLDNGARRIIANMYLAAGGRRHGFSMYARMDFGRFRR